MTHTTPTFTRSRLVVVALASLFALIGVIGAGGGTASAHSGEQSYVYLEIFDTAIEGRVEYPISDLNRVLGLDIPLDEDAALDAMEQSADLIIGYSSEHLSMGPADGGEWTLEFSDEFEILDIGARSYGIVHFEVAERFDPPPRQFRVTYDGIIESDPDRDAFLLIATDFGSGTFNNEADEFLRFSDGDTEQIVDLDDSSFFKGFVAVVDLGVEHIRIGTDHILFVLALVLPSVLVFRTVADGREQAKLAPKQGEWHPSDRFGSTLWRVLKIVTMFTIAHSITLALGGLGIIELSPRLVESIIAISIAAAAIHNIRPIFVNKEWALAFGFGLFHGFGFAGLLADLGLDQSRRLISLLAFNIGVELGQAAIILMVFPLLFIMRRSRWYLPIMNLGSVLLALVALAWAAERIFDYDLSVSDTIDPVFRWPRSALVIAVGYAVATGIWWFGKQRGDLRPTMSIDEANHEELPSDADRELVDS